MNDRTGEVIGLTRVIRRGPDSVNIANNKVQYYIECLGCGFTQLVVSRNLKRSRSHYEKGCKACIKAAQLPKTRYSYGKNINGFYDRTKIVRDIRV